MPASMRPRSRRSSRLVADAAERQAPVHALEGFPCAVLGLQGIRNRLWASVMITETVGSKSLAGLKRPLGGTRSSRGTAGRLSRHLCTLGRAGVSRRNRTGPPARPSSAVVASRTCDVPLGQSNRRSVPVHESSRRPPAASAADAAMCRMARRTHDAPFAWPRRDTSVGLTVRSTIDTEVSSVVFTVQPAAASVVSRCRFSVRLAVKVTSNRTASEGASRQGRRLRLPRERRAGPPRSLWPADHDGRCRARTSDLLGVNQALSQLS
jgi:hypothetical protein